MSGPQQDAATQAHRHEEGRFNLSAWALRHQPLVVFIITLITLFGVLSYSKLAQSEDPPFTFRVMVIKTLWPGATAQQVQEQITDRIGKKLQEAPNTDFMRSYSRPGESLIFYTMKDSAPASAVAEQWYQVRKKVGDISATLPPGVQGPFFNDEFGDVYTNIYTLQGDGFSPAQLHDYADRLRTVLLRVPGVAKVDYFGDQPEHIYVEISNTQLTRLGVSAQQIAQAINSQNAVTSAGTLTTADDRVFVRPSGQYANSRVLADTLIRVNGKSIRLGDIAIIRRGYQDPAVEQMRLGGSSVLGIGITMQPGRDVVHLGKALSAKFEELQAQLPAGLTLKEVSSMPKAVSHSVDDFLRSVAEAVAIVLAVSLVSLGLRTGMVVVISIPVVLAVTALFMDMFGIGLHKVSLGTLVLALGLLVDDAIIAVEMMAVKLEQGWSRARAAAFAYTSTAFPMLTGTLVTVAGFLPIALAKSSTGEYTRSIFQVSAIALITSWFAAVVLIPLLGYRLLPERKREAHLPDDHEHDIYNTRFYQRLRGWVGWCVDRRYLVLGATALVFVAAMACFRFVPQQFFPSSDRSELLVDVRLQEGASFAATLRQVERLEKTLEAVRKSTTRSASSAPARRASICRWTNSSPPRTSPSWSSPRIRSRTARSSRNGCSPCCASSSRPSAAACRAWRTARPWASRCSSASAATRSPTCARWPNRWQPKSAPIRVRPMCSSTGTSRPNVRCASRSTSRRRASWASVPATSRTSWP